MTETAVAVVVRNATDLPASSLQVEGTFESRGATARGRSDRVSPAVVGPGEWGFGLVLFDEPVPKAAEFAFDVSSTGVVPATRLVVLDAAPAPAAPFSWAITVENQGPASTHAVTVDLFCADATEIRGFARSTFDVRVPPRHSTIGILTLRADGCVGYGAVAAPALAQP